MLYHCILNQQQNNCLAVFNVFLFWWRQHYKEFLITLVFWTKLLSPTKSVSYRLTLYKGQWNVLNFTKPQIAYQYASCEQLFAGRTSLEQAALTRTDPNATLHKEQRQKKTPNNLALCVHRLKKTDWCIIKVVIGKVFSDKETPLVLIANIFALIIWKETLMRRTHRFYLHELYSLHFIFTCSLCFLTHWKYGGPDKCVQRCWSALGVSSAS